MTSDVFGSIQTIIVSLLTALQSLSVLIVVFGLISAFLWRLAFYIQLVLGFIVTVFFTYFVYSVTSRLGLPITWALLVFGAGVLVSIIQALRAAVMAILNGLILTWLGIFLFMVAGQTIDSMYTFNLVGLLTNLAGTLITSFIIAAILVAVSAYVGGRVFSIRRFVRSGSPREYYPSPDRDTSFSGSYPRQSDAPVNRPARGGDRQIDRGIEEGVRIRFREDPSKGSCEICGQEWDIDSEVFECLGCGANFHHDCIEAYVSKSHRCPNCQIAARLSLN